METLLEISGRLIPSATAIVNPGLIYLAMNAKNGDPIAVNLVTTLALKIEGHEGDYWFDYSRDIPTT